MKHTTSILLVFLLGQLVAQSPFPKKITITQPEPLRASISTEVIDCAGDGDGSIFFSATGGTAPYTFSKDGGENFESPSLPTLTPENYLFKDLSGGTYQLTLKDDTESCLWDTTIALYEPAPLTATIDTQVVRCHGDDNGSIKVHAEGGNGTYSYKLDHNYTSFSDRSDFPNLAPHRYTATIKDVKGCTMEVPDLDIQEPAPFLISSLASSDISCYDAKDGSITFSTTGGNAPTADVAHTYYWNNTYTSEPAFASAENTQDTLTGSLYRVYAEDSKGCISPSRDITLYEPPALVVKPEFVNVVCGGANEGSITFEGDRIKGGTAPHYLSVSTLTSRSTSERSFDKLPADWYRWEVEDNNGCSLKDSFEIIEPSPLRTSLVSVDSAHCYGDASGSITLSTTGGNKPYRYTLDGIHFQRDSVLAEQTAGTYKAIVWDVKNCPDTVEATIGQPTQIIPHFSTTGVSCKGNAEGSISLSITGGKGGYDVLWHTGDTGYTLSKLYAGDYHLTITDRTQCQVEGQTTVTEPLHAFEMQLDEPINASCDELSDGSLTASLTGGESPYAYVWNDPVQTTTSLGIGGLAYGRYYSLMARDALGCQLADSAFIGYDTPFVIQDIYQDTLVLCDGEAFLSNQSQTAIDHYQWSYNGQTYSQEPQLSIYELGSYHLRLSDNKGCLDEKSFEVVDSPDYITPLFLGNTHNLHGDTLMLIELSWPMPDEISWHFDKSARVTKNELGAMVSFPPHLDSSSVILTARKGQCVKSYKKTFYFDDAIDNNITSRLGFQGIEKVILSPNPNDGHFYTLVELTDEAALDFVVMDAVGEVHFETTSQQENAFHRKEIKLDELPVGVYFLHIIHPLDRKIIRFIIR